MSDIRIMSVYTYDQDIINQELQASEHNWGSSPKSEQEQLALEKYLCLPWELRHQVHTFYVQGCFDNEVIVRRTNGNNLALLVRQSIGTHSYQWIDDPVLLGLIPDRVRLDIIREILGTYYMTRTFKFVHRDLDLLRPFLESNSFGLVMRPADYVRHLHLQIQPFEYAQLRNAESKNDEETRCLKALDSLAGLQTPSATVDVHVDLTRDVSDHETDEELLDDAARFLFQAVKSVDTLSRGGLNIRMIFNKGWDGTDSTVICSSSLSSLDDCMAEMNVACQ